MRRKNRRGGRKERERKEGEEKGRRGGGKERGRKEEERMERMSTYCTVHYLFSLIFILVLVAVIMI